ILGPEYDHLAALNLDLTDLPVPEADLAETVDQIRVHLNTLVRALPASEVLPTMLAQVSGHLLAEFEVLQTLFKSGEVIVDAGLVRQVRQKFAPVHDYLEQELADLNLLVIPPRPPQPDPDTAWTADEWLDWAVEHYLPYRFWLEEIGQHDEEIAAQADAYAEWLYDHYPSLRLTYPRMVYQGLLALHDRLTGPAPVLVVVVDNLNHKFHPDLVCYLQARGFFAEDSIPHLAMLPSCTEVSKRCLFIGQPEPFPGTAYEKPTLAAWGSALGGRRVRYLPHVGALRSVKRREHDVYFLNYLPIDEALHDDEQQTGVPHSAAVRQRLQALAGDIRAFAERIGAERNLVVIVISDHGSTRI
ncbi:MAG: PglZ domain-containing protein, partial [Anaerolineae bacterium]|nr:PglZ domain-containing protein [Anaerolineae bacterium]